MSARLEDPTPVLTEYLDAHLTLMGRRMPSGWIYNGPLDLVRREATAYTRIATYDAEVWNYTGSPRECFRDALLLAARNAEELTYVEGYAYRSLLPCHHAWCITGDREVIDATWDPAGVEYLGIPFWLEYVEDVTSERGYYGILDNWQMNYPLCREPLDPLAVVGSLR